MTFFHVALQYSIVSLFRRAWTRARPTRVSTQGAGPPRYLQVRVSKLAQLIRICRSHKIDAAGRRNVSASHVSIECVTAMLAEVSVASPTVGSRRQCAV